jgi:hypothetical protein
VKTEKMIQELRSLSVNLPDTTDPNSKMEISPLLRKVADRLEDQQIAITILNEVLDLNNKDAGEAK